MIDWNPATHPFKASWSTPAHDRLGSNHTRVEVFATEDEAKAAICKPFEHGYKHATVQFLDQCGARGVWVRKWKRENGKTVSRWADTRLAARAVISTYPAEAQP